MAGPVDAQKAVEDFRKRLDALEASEMKAVINAYKPVNTAIRKQVQAVTKVAQAKKLKPWQVMRLGMMKDLRGQIAGEMKQFAEIAATQISQGQAAAVALSQQAAEATMTAGLPPGITPKNRISQRRKQTIYIRGGAHIRHPPSRAQLPRFP